MGMIFVRPCDYIEDVIKHVNGILNFEGTPDLVDTQKEMMINGKQNLSKIK